MRTIRQARTLVNTHSFTSRAAFKAPVTRRARGTRCAPLKSLPPAKSRPQSISCGGPESVVYMMLQMHRFAEARRISAACLCKRERAAGAGTSGAEVCEPPDSGSGAFARIQRRNRRGGGTRRGPLSRRSRRTPACARGLLTSGCPKVSATHNARTAIRAAAIATAQRAEQRFAELKFKDRWRRSIVACRRRAGCRSRRRSAEHGEAGHGTCRPEAMADPHRCRHPPCLWTRTTRKRPRGRSTRAAPPSPTASGSATIRRASGLPKPSTGSVTPRSPTAK